VYPKNIKLRKKRHMGKDFNNICKLIKVIFWSDDLVNIKARMSRYKINQSERLYPKRIYHGI
jgi:hypothetical protein